MFSTLFDGFITLFTTFLPASVATDLPASTAALPISFAADEANAFAP